MDDAIARALELVESYDSELRRELPEGAPVFDVHTHLGNDIDGMVGDLDELLGIMDRYGVERAFTFCLDEPDRHPGFRAANERTLAFAERAGGRLVPFVRLDLTEGPIEEAVRVLDLGARGIKLHPRAQKFTADDARLDPIFELAADRRVPILIHGGLGMPPIAAGLHRLVDRYGTTLIIAHAGIADMAALAGHFAGHPGVFFDTSTWSPIDLLDFYRQVPPEQVVYASDYPYGTQPNSLLIAVRTARAAGLEDAQIRELLHGNANRIANGEPPLAPSQPRGSDTLTQSMQLARIHQYLSMATPLLWTRQPDTVGVLGLAINTCAERNGHHHEEVERIRELLERARAAWLTLPELEDEAERVRTTRTTFRLLHLADILAVTAR
jgi:predicted TIM-barrel fold metal-dependent hydrolase